MSHRLARALALAAALAPLLYGCDATTAADPADALARGGPPAPRERPFRGTCTTTFVGPAPVVEGGVPVGLSIVVEGECRLAHLGRTAYHVDQFYAFADGSLALDVTFTAANGARLYGADVIEGFAFPTPEAPTFAGVMALAGGTGRFASAAGGGPYTVALDLAAGTGLVTYEGVIAY